MKWLTENWFLMALVCLAIFQLCYVFIDYVVKYIARDQRTTIHKTWRKILLAIALAVAVANPIVGEINNRQKNREAEAGRTKFVGEIMSLRHAIETNTSIPPEIRLSVLKDTAEKYHTVDTDEVDLNAWRLELNDVLTAERAKASIAQEQREKATRQQKEAQEARMGASVQPYYEYFDYAIRKLDTGLREIARTKGDKLVSNFDRLPTLISSNDQRVAHLRFQRNTNWNFEARINRPRYRNSSMDRDLPPTPTMAISGSAASLFQIGFYIRSPNYVTQEQTITTSVSFSNYPPLSESQPFTNYAKSIDKCVRYFLAWHAEQYPFPNRP